MARSAEGAREGAAVAALSSALEAYAAEGEDPVEQDARWALLVGDGQVPGVPPWVM